MTLTRVLIAAWLVSVVAICGWLGLSLAWALTNALIDGTAPPGAEFLFFTLGILAVSCYAAIRRLLRRDLSSVSAGAAVVASLATWGWGWLLGAALVTVRGLWRDAQQLGAPPDNGSYLADALIFLVGTLVIAAPGLVGQFAARLARREPTGAARA